MNPTISPARFGPASARNSAGWPMSWCTLSLTCWIQSQAARMENREIARLLTEAADLMEIAGEDGFRIRSYRNAASAIESYPERIDAILRDPERKVTDIPGVGKGIAAALDEIGQRGSFEKRDLILQQYPPTLLELLRIQGLG